MAQGRGTLGWVALVVVLVLVVSGCGGDSATQTTGASRPAGAAAESATTTSAPPTKAAENPEAKAKKGDATGVVIPKGKPERGLTPKEEAETPVADLSISVPGLDPAGKLAATYTCDGKGISLPVSWQGVPPDSEELALFVMNLAPVEGKLFFDWAVAGIDPQTTTSLKAGQLPAGAVVGRNGEGKQDYSLCPPGPGAETYIVSLYALTEALEPEPGFDPLQFREEAREASDSVGVLSISYG